MTPQECFEEAGIPMDVARTAVATGAVSYRGVFDVSGVDCVKDDVLFTFDLELQRGFTPANNDGEVESFELWTMDRVLKTIETNAGDFKPNCIIVILDFAIRRGLVKPEEKGYLELLRMMRAGDCA